MTFCPRTKKIHCSICSTETTASFAFMVTTQYKPRATGLLRQAFDALEQVRLFVSHGADFGEELEFRFLLFVFAGDGFPGIPLGEQTMPNDFFALSQQA